MNVCIVGYGEVGKVHANVISELDGITLYGICDNNRERAALGAQQHCVKAFYDFDDMLKDTNVQSVHICTPHYLHYEMTVKAIAHGKKVFVEKPVTMTREEFDKLYAEFSDCDDIVPIFQNRANLCVQTLKTAFEQDKTLGRFISAKGIITWKRDRAYYEHDAWRGTKAYEGGGVLINQTIHSLDLMVNLGGPLQSVCASASNKSLRGIIEVEDTIDALMTYQNGANGIFYATNAHTTNDAPFFEFAFENALFRYIDRKLYRDNVFLCEDDSTICGKQYWGSGHEKIFYDYYINHKAIKIKDIKNTMDAMFAIYESAEKGEPVILSDAYKK